MNLNRGWFLAPDIWIVVSIAVAVLVYKALRRWGQRWITKLINRIVPAEEDYSRASSIILNQVLLWAGTAVIVGIMIFVILPRPGVDIAWATNALRDLGLSALVWLHGHGVRVAIILAFAFAFQHIARGIIPGVVYRSTIRNGKGRSAEEIMHRAETLSSFLAGMAVIAIWVIAVLMILSEFGIQIGPLLVGAGFVGLAIGIGAQGLIRDILSGLFIILEDQYSKEDWVQIAGIVGEVEYLSLRRTKLRDLDGTSHVVPNGEVKIASNFTRDWARVNMIISVGYGHNLDRASEVIKRVSREMTEETYWRGLIMETFQVLKVENFEDSGMVIKILGKTRALKRWEVMGELRRRIKKALDEERIEISWPNIKLYFGQSPTTDVLSQLEAQLSLGSKTKRKVL